MTNQEQYELICEKAEKYDKIQADYENHLKADMVAMLTDIQLEIEDNEKPISATSYDGDLYNGAFNDGLGVVTYIIQQKIDALCKYRNGYT